MNTKLIMTVAIVFVATVVSADDFTIPAVPSPNLEQGEGEIDKDGSKMTGARLGELVRTLDADATHEGSVWQFTFQDRPFMVVFDEKADRMRMFTPIGPEKLLNPGLMRRMLQANFDSALDARYAVANKLIWGVFIHPLSPLDQDQFASAVVQILNVATSFGGKFSSGLFTYGGGDSVEENKKLLEELRKRMAPTI